MASSPNYKRNYKQEYKTAKARKEVSAGSNGVNASRKRARRALEKAGVNVKGKDVDHKDGNAKNNSRSNLRAVSQKANRSYARNSKGGRK